MLDTREQDANLKEDDPSRHKACAEAGVNMVGQGTTPPLLAQSSESEQCRQPGSRATGLHGTHLGTRKPNISHLLRTMLDTDLRPLYYDTPVLKILYAQHPLSRFDGLSALFFRHGLELTDGVSPRDLI